MAFSFDSKWLASGSNDNIVRLWDAETEAEQKAFEINKLL